MTLITAVNLFDKILLTADTRVTLGQTGDFVDNVRKISHLYPPAHEYKFDSNEPYALFMSVAGHVDFCKFIFYSLKNKINENLLSADFPLFRNAILKVIKNICNEEWISTGGEYLRHACFIFAGVNNSRKRRFYTKELRHLYQQFTKKFPKQNISMPHQLAYIFHKNLFSVPSVLADGIPDLGLFSVEIKPSSINGFDINISDTQVGQGLQYGSGIGSIYLPDDISLKLLFNSNISSLADHFANHFSKNIKIGGKIVGEIIDGKSFKFMALSNQALKPPVVFDGKMYLYIDDNTKVEFQDFYEKITSPALGMFL